MAVIGNPKVKDGVDLKLSRKSGEPPFQRAVVVEVVGDPTNKGAFFHMIPRDEPGIVPYDLENPLAFYNNAPRNSVVARPITSTSKFTKDLRIYYPFFSSHFALPVKPGEHVWVFEDEDYGFWISRISSIEMVEDPNYCHAERENILNVAIQTQQSGSKEKPAQLWGR